MIPLELDVGPPPAPKRSPLQPDGPEEAKASWTNACPSLASDKPKRKRFLAPYRARLVSALAAELGIWLNNLARDVPPAVLRETLRGALHWMFLAKRNRARRGHVGRSVPSTPISP